MKTPEQLRLDFSKSDCEVLTAEDSAANVYCFVDYKKAKESKDLIDVYSAILATVKHIGPRKKA